MDSNLLLQMYTGKPGHEHLLDFEFVDAIVCTYANSMGFAVFATFVYGGILLSIYLTTDSPLIPAVLILLTGGLTIPQVAAPGVGIATLVLLLSGAGVLTLLYYKYSR